MKPFDHDPFAQAVQAATHDNPTAAPRCPTRPWWHKLGNRWWRIGTRFTVTFPGDSRALVWGSGDLLATTRRQNRLEATIEFGEIDLRDLGAVSPATIAALTEADAFLKIPPPPTMLGQVWAYGPQAIPQMGRLPVTHRGGYDTWPELLISGPFSPWAPPDYAVTAEVIAAAFAGPGRKPRD